MICWQCTLLKLVDKLCCVQISASDNLMFHHQPYLSVTGLPGHFIISLVCHWQVTRSFYHQSCLSFDIERTVSSLHRQPCSSLTELSVHYIIKFIRHWQDYQLITSWTLFIIDRTISSLHHQPCLSLTGLSVHCVINLVCHWHDYQFITSSALFVIDRTIRTI